MLTAAEVERIARLARLDLTDDEANRYAEQLSAVLDYAAEIEGVDVEGILPTASVLPIRSVMRAGDGPGAPLPRVSVLANAPLSDGASFEVPATVGDGEPAD